MRQFNFSSLVDRLWRSCVVLMIAAPLALVSCEGSDDDGTFTPKQKVVSKIENVYQNVATTLEYDSKGRVTKETTTDNVGHVLFETTFVYRTNTITSSSSNEATVSTLNGDGSVKSFMSEYSDQLDPLAPMTGTGTLTYNGRGYLIKQEMSATYTSGTFTNYTDFVWSEDKLQSAKTYEGTDTYNSAFQYGPISSNASNLDLNGLVLNMPMYMYGYLGKRAHNLIEKITITNSFNPLNDGVQTLRYALNADGYVTDIFWKWNSEPEVLWYKIFYK